MAVTQYIGARYVPLFADPLQWDNERTYEPLTIVQHQGNSYTSRQAVPVGIDITNESYWALTGNYNAQIEAYRQEVQTFDARITANTTKNTEQDGKISEIDALSKTNESDITKMKSTMYSFPGYIEPDYLGRTYVDSKVKYFASNVTLSTQAGCYIDGAILTTMLNTSTNNVTVQVTDNTHTYITTTTTKSWGHANSIAYDGSQYLYVVPLGNEVYKVDKSSLSTVSTITFDHPVYSISKDLKTGKWYVCSNENENGLSLYEWDGNETTPKLTKKFDSDDRSRASGENNNVPQGYTVFNDFVFCSFAFPSQIVVRDLSGNKLATICIHDDWGYYQVSELESLSFDEDGNGYIFGNSYIDEGSIRYSVCAKINPFTGNLYHLNNHPQPVVAPYPIYVDSSTSNRFDSDGSSQRPLSTLQEAFMKIDRDRYASLIHAQGTFTESFKVQLFNRSSVTLIGEDDKHFKFDGSIFLQRTGLYIRYCDATNSSTTNYVIVSEYQNDGITMMSCNFNNIAGQYVVVSYGPLYITQCTFNAASGGLESYNGVQNGAYPVYGDKDYNIRYYVSGVTMKTASSHK